ncbi:histidine triad nucleotide-binding protein [Oscillospiraceae bacterium OttesenSCG-928-F05]|nr:histidine triad nucleotide-binding protein [Oscillospiraceae bacterium OttesenSCG-928-F05]
MDNCIFCKIAAGTVPSKKAYEDDRIVAFHDLEPRAPVHLVVIPKAHIAASAAELDETKAETVGYLFAKIPEITEKLGLEKGFRVVTNAGEHAGQTVPHLHFHVLGGAMLSEHFGKD